MSPQTRQPSSPSAFATVAPGIFVLLWSTGFIGARFGLPYIEPFTFLLLRFIVVVILLGGLALALRSPWPRGPGGWGRAAITGLLMHGGYLGGVFFAIDHGMPASLSALIVSMQPIITGLLSRPLLGEPVSGRQWLGLLLGFVGVGFVVGEKLLAPGAGPPPITAATMAAVIVALLSTTAGTLYQKRYGADMPLIGGTAAQYIAAGLAMLALSLAFETRQIDWHIELIFALAWLVLVLSVGAILLLMLLIRLSSAARVSSLFYLVPPATALEAYLLFGEQFGPMALLGLALASAGVALARSQR